LAEPNGPLITGATRQLVGDLFEYRDLGSVEIGSFDDPVPLRQVMFENTSSPTSSTTRSALIPVRPDRACIASSTAV